MQDLNEIAQALGRIEGKMDMLIGSDLDKRIRSLEKSRAWLAGISAAVASAASTLVTLLTHGSIIDLHK